MSRHWTGQGLEFSQVLMILRPAGRFLTIPLPPGPFAARFLTAAIRPPLLFFAIDVFFLYCVFSIEVHMPYKAGIETVFVFAALIFASLLFALFLPV